VLTTRDNDIARLVHLCDRQLERYASKCPTTAALYDRHRVGRWTSTVITWKRDRFRSELPKGKKTRT
jgi:hypothetical protein